MAHRAVVVAIATLGVVVALVIAVHAGAQPPPGSTIVWASPTASSAAQGGTAGTVPQASPAAGGPVSGDGAGPVAGLFGRLNTETRQSASGQFSILQELSTTLRGWVERLLNGATGR